MSTEHLTGLQDVAKPVSEETTDSALFVRTSADGLADFSRERIVEAMSEDIALVTEYNPVRSAWRGFLCCRHIRLDYNQRRH